MSETTISQQIIKKFNKRYADLQMRLNGAYWGKIKNAENALSLYEEEDTPNFKQKKWLINNYFKKVIMYHKLSFFLSKTITRIFYPPKSIRLQLSSYTSENLSEQKNSFVFKDIRIPLPVNESDEVRFNDDFLDIIFPYLVNKTKTTNSIMSLINNEGPYEIDKNVCLSENDIVIDCGANIGVFSALAAAKRCTVYSFEPFPYVIENYLSKTAEWNNNINICQYALWHEETTLEFEQNFENIGSSTLVTTTGFGNKIKIQAIKLDDFVHRNNLPKIDFIKADIEGAERNMLLGARDVIREFSPKISICTYHLPDDPKVLREILLDIQPKYKIQEQFKKMYAYVPEK